jgi:Xaa-Pro aminopeptidase
VDAKPAESPLEGLIIALKQMGLADKSVGVDEDQLRPGYLEAMGEKLPRARFTPVARMLREVRQVKTAEEVQRLRAVVRMTEQALRSACAIVHEGTTAVELVREFERSIVSQGGRPRFTQIQIGRNAVYLGGTRINHPTPLRVGDTIWCDTGAVYQGYWSDIARIISLGEPSPRARRIYNALLAGERAGIAGTRVGGSGAQIFELVMRACREGGHPDYRRHHVGHSIGLEVYESPMLSPTNHTAIEENMVINIETPYYEFGLGAFHVEDPYVVKSDGNHDLLTTLTRELIVVEP